MKPRHFYIQRFAFRWEHILFSNLKLLLRLLLYNVFSCLHCVLNRFLHAVLFLRIHTRPFTCCYDAYGCGHPLISHLRLSHALAVTAVSLTCLAGLSNGNHDVLIVLPSTFPINTFIASFSHTQLRLLASVVLSEIL